MMTEEEKIALFSSLFQGREDVYATRFMSQKTGRGGYSPACENEWVRGICGKPKVKCAQCGQRKFRPLTPAIIRQHLVGQDGYGRDFVLGVYPLLPDGTCRFLAVDFDKDDWQQDALTYMEACRKLNIPAALERSRSGNGGHIWVFFDESIPAAMARTMGAHVLTEAMDMRPELGFKSYDRFFPNQDHMPQGGFGNLIALPLQGMPRKQGNSVFVNHELQPHADQWGFLSALPKMVLNEVAQIADQAVQTGRVTGVRLPVLDEDEATQPWAQLPSRKPKPRVIAEPLPEALEIVIKDQLYIPRENLPSSLINRIIRLAAFQNPEFYRAQAMHLSIYDKPRIISCAELYPNHVALPRGCAEELVALLVSHKIRPSPDDQRHSGARCTFEFQGTLRPRQLEAAKKLVPHDLGVLSAGTSFGKTVLAAYMVAQRGVNTLVLVHRTQLLDQWRAQLANFLGLPVSEIGIIGGGKRKPNGKLDVATIQSLYRKHAVDDCVADYGHIVVDECHHISAVSFEQVLRRCTAKYVLGLSATTIRKDGHQPIIFMQCGPARYQTSPLSQAQERPFHHRVLVRKTGSQFADDCSAAELYTHLMNDEVRNEMIVRDVITALDIDRSPIILTERTEHLNWFYDRLCGTVRNLIMLRGGMGKRYREEMAERMAEIPETEERVILATGRYIGEGFDDSRLDTLFLTLPVSWKGTIAQYAGRLHRLNDMKREVRIYDYADLQIPMAARMFKRRCSGYRAIGYEVDDSDPHQPGLFDELE